MKKSVSKKARRAKKLIAKPAAVLAFLRDLFAEEIEALNRKNLAMPNR
jgi:hypothetical protein